MRFIRPVALAVALSAAAGLAAGPAGAATAPRAAHATPAKVKLVKQISLRNGQFISLHKRVRSCAIARPDVAAALKIRKSALRKVSTRASVRTLRAKRAAMSRAVLRLSRAAKRCSTAPIVQTTVVAAPAPAPVAPGAPAPVTVIVTPPAQSGPVAGPITVAPIDLTLPIRLEDILNGSGIDLTAVLKGAALPQVLKLVDIDQLTAPVCLEDVVCVGIDTAALLSAVKGLAQANLVNGLLGSLLTLDLQGTLAQVTALLGVGDLDALVAVQRLGDGALRLVPVGPLAQLAGSAVIPLTQVGAISIAG